MSYKTELQEAEKKLLELEKQKAAIEHQMRGWIQVIEGLRVLAEKPSFDEPPTREEVAAEMETPSLPHKILLVLAEADSPIGATQIRDHLVASGMVDAAAKNLLINIHTTLKRLVRTEQVDQVPLADGSKLYKYVSPLQRALKLPYGAPQSLANTLLRVRKMHAPRGRLNQNKFDSRYNRPRFGGPPVKEDT